MSVLSDYEGANLEDSPSKNEAAAKHVNRFTTISILPTPDPKPRVELVHGSK